MSNKEDFVIINDKLMGYKGNEEHVVVPDGVTIITEDAFYDCKSIKSITLPESVTTIKTLAFCNCVNLNAIKIPSKVTTINYGTFSGCFSLEKVVLPDNLRLICANAFSDCRKLKEIVLPENETSFKLSSLKVIWDYFTETGHALVIKSSFLKQYFSLVQTEAELKRKIKVSKKGIVLLANVTKDVVVIKNLFSLYKKIPLDELDEYIELTSDSVEILPYLLEYKNSKYLQEQEAFYTDETEKSLGLKERSVSDWKKIFNFYKKDGGIIITKYKAFDRIIEVPEKIGGVTVTGIGEKAFSAYAPRLMDKEKINRKKLEQIILPDSIKSIADDAFFGCTLLVMNAKQNSYVEQYAKKHHIPFIML